MRAIISILFINCLFYTIADGQNFVAKPNPFNIQMVNIEQSCCVGMKYFFEDIDGDKTKDVIIAGMLESDTSIIQHPNPIGNIRYFMEFQVNIGTLVQPDFKAREAVFESFEWEKGESFWLPAIKDLNNDGLMDFVVSSYVDSLKFQYLLFYFQKPDHSFERTISTDWNLDPFPPFSMMVPEIADLDNDGDFDILMSGYFCYNYNTGEQFPKIVYAKNIGTNTNPEFLGWYDDPYGLKPGDGMTWLSVADLDLDGDMDVLGLVQSEDDGAFLRYYENKGGKNAKPRFENPVIYPFGIPIPASVEDSYLFVTIKDIDTDGDFDIFIPHLDSVTYTLEFYENQICSPQMEYLDVVICKGENYQFGDLEFNTPGKHLIKTTLSNGCLKITELNLSIFEINTEITQFSHYLTAKQDNDYLYQWFDCDSGLDIPMAVTNTFFPAWSGNFGVRITHSNGCEATSDCFYVIASGISESLIHHLVLYPNPTRGDMNVINNSGKRIEKITIFNHSGQKIKEFIKPDDKLKIHFLVDGLYFLEVKYDEGVITKKILCIRH